MPFRIDVPSPTGKPFMAPTQAYQDYLDDVKKHGDIFGPFTGVKHTEANLYISVTRQTISWSIVAPLEHDYTSQQWRNEVYGTAAVGHREISEGCVGYYRGTNSLHVKRQHQTANEAAHNHNHYRFNGDVTPELFAQHLRNFVKHDKSSTHNGSSKVGVPKFLTSADAEEIISAYTLCYQEEVRTGLKKEYLNDSYYKYTREDIEELDEGLKIEGACRDMSKSEAHTMAGLHYDRAELRQHKDTPAAVIESRRIYQKRADELALVRTQRETFAEKYYAVKPKAPVLPLSTSEDLSTATVSQLKKSSLAGFFNRKPSEELVSPQPMTVNSASETPLLSPETVDTLRQSRLGGFFNRKVSLDDAFKATVQELAREDDSNIQLPTVNTVARPQERGHTDTVVGIKGLSLVTQQGFS